MKYIIDTDKKSLTLVDYDKIKEATKISSLRSLYEKKGYKVEVLDEVLQEKLDEETVDLTFTTGTGTGTGTGTIPISTTSFNTSLLTSTGTINPTMGNSLEFSNGSQSIDIDQLLDMYDSYIQTKEKE